MGHGGAGLLNNQHTLCAPNNPPAFSFNLYVIQKSADHKCTKIKGTRTKKKRRVTVTDSFKAILCNIIFIYFFYFLCNFSSLLNMLAKFHSNFSDGNEKKYTLSTVPTCIST